MLIYMLQEYYCKTQPITQEVVNVIVEASLVLGRLCFFFEVTKDLHNHHLQSELRNTQKVLPLQL